MDTALIIDASFAIRLLLPNPQQQACLDLVTKWHQDGCLLCVPSLWLYEITSTLCKAVHFNHITQEEGEEVLILARNLGVTLFPPDDLLTTSAYSWTVRLKRAAAYDSFYLVLAEGLKSELWTADKKLAGAAGVSWVHDISELND
jgi:predicted nucleic acid-binding protein